METAPDDIDAWFKSEVLTHEDALTRYLRRSWPNSEDIHDLRQETYIRIYEAAQKQRPAVARTFLFSIARHLMTDRIRKRRVIAIDSVRDFDVELVDELSPEQRLSGHQELRLLAQALDSLPKRCRDVIWLRRIEGLSQRQAAERLSLSEKTVEKQVMKGMKRLTDAVFGASSIAGEFAKSGRALGGGEKDSSDEDGDSHGKQ